MGDPREGVVGASPLSCCPLTLRFAVVFRRFGLRKLMLLLPLMSGADITSIPTVWRKNSWNVANLRQRRYKHTYRTGRRLHGNRESWSINDLEGAACGVALAELASSHGGEEAMQRDVPRIE